MALDESLYNLTEDERTFFKQETGIPDDNQLRSHICRLQAEAYEVCIGIRELEPRHCNMEKEFMAEFV
jgi:hypothetical protein